MQSEKRRRETYKKARHNIDQRKNRTALLVTDESMPFGYVEAYKSLRTNLKFISAGSKSKSILITSAMPMESKSNTAINLAATFAADNKRVILIEGDMRKPSLGKMLNIKRNTAGLSSLLSDDTLPKDFIVKVDNLNIDVIPSGLIPPNPSELLATSRMREAIEALEEYYDYVIIDSPPISLVTDAAVIGSAVDGAILVVRSDYAQVESVQLAKKKLEDVGVRILGVVLACYEPKRLKKQSGYYDSYHYEYGYRE